MTTDTILAAAQYGYARYYQGRHGRSWDTDPNKCRWLYVAAKALNGEITTAREAHKAYVDGYDPRHRDYRWDDLSVFRKRQWADVLAAMVAAGEARAA